MVFDATHLLATYGVLGVGVVLFLETGLLLGVILPGETLTVVAGAYSHSGAAGAPHPNLALLIVAAACGAVAGGQMGFWLGRRAGPRLFDRSEGLLFKHRYLERTHEYFDRFGPSTIMIGRFVPFVRTFVSPAAGVGGMRPSTFAPFNLAGGIVWAICVAMIGYVIGGLVSIERYGLLVTVGIAAVSLIPLVLHLRALRAT